ncbi:hypothetical protein KDA_33760 [Dictyobacter alpinus]|uniref:Uncharacterized protein n=1 Tax=Dictyobacter alpinus TaxID=2014873 RepID=A0A402B9B3_9CHLR|nr:hypothetical protein [Dictyobacter alpinus]GCE27892.1 hypothetical protein KDA_33760 [Dictyobacter alpinus]
MRLAIGLHLLWKRLEIALCALVVPGLIFESSIANGWVYGGTFVAFLRGLFLDLVIYICARQAFLLIGKKKVFSAAMMAFVALSITYVSAINNLGWVLSGHEMAGMLGSLGAVLGAKSAFYSAYEFTLAVCLPLSLLAIALVDLDHFFEHGVNQDHLDNQAMLSDERRMHRTAFLKAQRVQKGTIQNQYEEVAEDRAQRFVDKARDGDLTFGSQTATPTTEQLPSPDIKQIEQPVQEIKGTVWPADRPHPARHVEQEEWPGMQTQVVSDWQ